MRWLLLPLILLGLASETVRGQIEVIVVPHGPVEPGSDPAAVPHPAYNGHRMFFKAIARGPSILPSCTYRWDLDGDGDFSDQPPQFPRHCVAGTPDGTTCYDLSASAVHTAPTGEQVFIVAAIELSCPGEPVIRAGYPVRIHGEIPAQASPDDNGTSHPELAPDEQLHLMREAALEDALWFLHLQLTGHAGAGSDFSGYFASGPAPESAAAFVWLAGLNGRLPAYPPGTYDHDINPGTWSRPPPPSPETMAANDFRYANDPYAETAMRALNFLVGNLATIPIPLEDEADDGKATVPDTNDGMALETQMATAVNYPDAIVAGAILQKTGLPILQAGDPGQVLGRPVEAILQQMVDYLVHAQIDPATGDQGGWGLVPNAALHDARAAVKAYASLYTSDRYLGGPGRVYVNDLCRGRMPGILKHNQDPVSGLARPQNGECTGSGTFAATGGALIAAGLLGWSQFDPADPTVVALDFTGAPITRGEARGVFDAYVAGLGSNWVSFQTDCTGLTSGLFDNDGGTNPEPHLRMDAKGNAEAIFSVTLGIKSQPNPDEFTQIGGHDWLREISIYAVRNQGLDGSWLDSPWGGYLPGPSELLPPLNTAYVALALTRALGSAGYCVGGDGDSDGWCAGSAIPDCDDGNASIFPGASDLCDGLNNDCLHPAWPALSGTRDADDDGDGLSECAGDCNDGDPAVWSAPGPARNLSLHHDPGTRRSTLTWDPPLATGGTGSIFDVIRSPLPDDHVGPATCVESDDADLAGEDPQDPPVGEVFFYLVRAENACGQGSVGTRSDGTPRVATDCLPGPVAVIDAAPNPAACRQLVSLDATGSFHLEPGRSLARYDWDFGDGVAAPDGLPVETHAYGAFGSYPVRVTVTDDGAPQKMDTETVPVDVSAGNSPPVADAGGPYTMQTAQPLALDGSGSSDPDGGCGDAITAYHWDLNDDGVIDRTEVLPTTDFDWGFLSSLSPPLQYPADPSTGLPTNTVRLTVTDTLGLTGNDSTTLTIYATPPVAIAAASPYPSACNQMVTLDGSASFHPDPARTITQWSWDFGDGSTGSGMVAAHVYAQHGVYTATLTVTDDGTPPATANDAVSVEVSLGNDPPIAFAVNGPFQTGIDSPAPLMLEAGGSYDPDLGCDQIVSYDWDLNGDDLFDVSSPDIITPVSWSFLVSLTPPLQYPADGRTGLPKNGLTLRVADRLGATSTYPTTLEIYENRPYARLAATPNPALCNEPVSLDATTSFHGWSPYYLIERYEWDLDNDGLVDASGGNAHSIHQFTTMGPNTVTLTIYDNTPLAESDTIDLTVNVSGEQPLVSRSGGNYTIMVGEDLIVDGSHSQHGCGTSIVLYEWDLNGDLVYDVATASPVTLVSWGTLTSLSPPVQIADPATHLPVNTVTLRVTDSLAATSTESSFLSINPDTPAADAGDIVGAPLLLLPGQQVQITSFYSQGSGPGWPSSADDLHDLFFAIDADGVGPPGSAPVDIVFHTTQGAATSGAASIDQGAGYLLGSVAYSKAESTPTQDDITVIWTFTMDWDYFETAYLEYGVRATDDNANDSGWSLTAMGVGYDNDLDLSGALSVTGADNGPIACGSTWVHGGEALTWSGMSVVHEGTMQAPASDGFFDLAVRDVGGGMWTQSAGSSLNLVTVAGSTSDPSDLHMVEITGIPATGDDVSDVTCDIKVDAGIPETLAAAAATGGTCSTVTLAWTPYGPGDTGASGDAGFDTYRVFYSTASPVTKGDPVWDDADDPALGSLAASGTEVTGLSPSTTYYFAIAGRDRAANEGPLAPDVEWTTDPAGSTGCVLPP